MFVACLKCFGFFGRTRESSDVGEQPRITRVSTAVDMVALAPPPPPQQQAADMERRGSDLELQIAVALSLNPDEQHIPEGGDESDVELQRALDESVQTERQDRERRKVLEILKRDARQFSAWETFFQEGNAACGEVVSVLHDQREIKIDYKNECLIAVEDFKSETWVICLMCYEDGTAKLFSLDQIIEFVNTHEGMLKNPMNVRQQIDDPEAAILVPENLTFPRQTFGMTKS